MVWGSRRIRTKVGAIHVNRGYQQAHNSVSQTVRNQFTSKIYSLKDNSAMSSVTKVKSQKNILTGLRKHSFFYKNLVYKNIKASKCLEIKNIVVLLLVAISISFEGFGKKVTFL